MCTLTTVGFPKSSVSQPKPCGRLYGSSRMLSLSGSMEPCDVTVSPGGKKEKHFLHEAKDDTHNTVQSLYHSGTFHEELKETEASCLVWEQAACPRTGNSFELPPPWFWQGLDRQRTVRWPSGSPVAYQLATNSPVWKVKKKKELRFSLNDR